MKLKLLFCTLLSIISNVYGVENGAAVFNPSKLKTIALANIIKKSDGRIYTQFRIPKLLHSDVIEAKKLLFEEQRRTGKSRSEALRTVNGLISIDNIAHYQLLAQAETAQRKQETQKATPRPFLSSRMVDLEPNQYLAQCYLARLGLNTGFSIHDLIYMKALPEIGYLDHGPSLNLSGLRINSLDGLHNIPKINTVVDINLFSNLITEIHPHTFNNLPNLCILYLGDNSITEIHPDTFNNLPYLYKLYLGDNSITEIHPDTFNNLPYLHKLYLGDNSITEIHPNTFSNLPMIESLLMDKNQITEIHPNAFSNLPILRELNLSENLITGIHPDTFNDLPKLRHLHLNNNSIKEIHPDTFNNLHELIFLFIYNNSIKALLPNTFNNMNALVNLQISYNAIKTFLQYAQNNTPSSYPTRQKKNPISDK